MSWYLGVLKQYGVFEGRARRREYWFFVLFNVIVSVLLTIVDLVIGSYSQEAAVGLLSGLYALAVLVPTIAVTVRRLHDTDRSGWWVFISLVPLGALVLLVFTVMDGDPGPNKHGDDPKGRSVLMGKLLDPGLRPG